MIHVHVRDANGAHILDADAYRDVTREIRREAGADVIVQITTEVVAAAAWGAMAGWLRRTFSSSRWIEGTRQLGPCACLCVGDRRNRLPIA